MTMKDFTSNAVSSLLACVIAMMGFWMIEARHYITRVEAAELIKVHSPYIQDKSLIMSELQRANQNNKDLFEALEENNSVLNQLKIEIAVLNKTLQTMSERREQQTFFTQSRDQMGIAEK